MEGIYKFKFQSQLFYPFSDWSVDYHFVDLWSLGSYPVPIPSCVLAAVSFEEGLCMFTDSIPKMAISKVYYMRRYLYNRIHINGL